MRCYDRPSPNFDERRDGAKPELIIVHYTAMASAEAALDRLTDAASKVSAHYLIDEAGNIFQMVDEEKRAWHAGVSSWDGKEDVNSRSIGIEISNRDGKPYTNEQLFSLTLLCKDIMFRHKIAPENVIGHSDVAPDRKQDPGEHFPWEKLSRHGIGVHPKITAADQFNAAAAARSPKKLKELFNAAGYGVNAFGKNKPKLKEIITAFQRHFEQDAFTDPAKKPGVANEDTVAMLRALKRLRQPPPAPPAA